MATASRFVASLPTAPSYTTYAAFYNLSASSASSPVPTAVVAAFSAASAAAADLVSAPALASKARSYAVYKVPSSASAYDDDETSNTCCSFL